MKKVIHISAKILLWALAGIVAIYASLWIWNIFVDDAPPNEDFNFGITFSNFYAKQLHLDWQETYLAILDDLGVGRLRLAAYWTDIEPEKGTFDYKQTDFQVNEAAKRNVEIILGVGQKLPRWPECHIPEWAKNSSDKDEALLNYIQTTVERYKDVEQIKYWQVENEAFLPGFGDCPPLDKDLLDREVALVRSLDSRPILMTDSGELGDWVRARRRGDLFGTTMYRFIWNDRFGKVHYPLPPTWFKFKDFVTRIFSGRNYAKGVIVVEMQAEAWGPDPIPYLTLEQQFDFMDFDTFKENIVYAKRAGFSDIYLWGAEWWYYLKTTQDHPEFWDYAQTLF